MPASRFFSNDELKCKHCGSNKMDQDFLNWLDKVREEYGKPMKLSSAYRCPEHNAKVSSTGRNGPHTTGKAVDVLVSGKDAHALTMIALKKGATGLGVRQNGAHDGRFLHLDCLQGPTRPWVWNY